MPSAVKSLYELADKYFVPRDEIELWLQSHVKQYSCTYMVSSHEIEMFKESIEGIEDAYYQSAKRKLCDGLHIEKKEDQAEGLGKIVNLTVRALV
jgi:hypothetical protein